MPFRLLQPQNPTTASTASPGQYWNSLLPVGETYAQNWPSPYWSQLTNCVTWAHANGQKVLLVIDQAPTWAGPSENDIYTSNFSDFAHVMGTLAADYNPAQYPNSPVDAIEIWNEADSDPSPTLGWGGSEQDYANMLCDAYSQIKEWAPSISVVSAGTKHLDYTWDYDLIHTDNAGSCFDVMGIHPYPFYPLTYWNNPAYYLNGSSGNNTLSMLSSLGKSIWFTEEGFDSGTTVNVPAALTDFYNYIDNGCAGCSAVQVAMWYTTYEANDPKSIFTATTDSNGHYVSFNPEPAFTNFTNVPANPSCYPSTCS